MMGTDHDDRHSTWNMFSSTVVRRERVELPKTGRPESIQTISKEVDKPSMEQWTHECLSIDSVHDAYDPAKLCELILLALNYFGTHLGEMRINS